MFMRFVTELRMLHDLRKVAQNGRTRGHSFTESKIMPFKRDSVLESKDLATSFAAGQSVSRRGDNRRAWIWFLLRSMPEPEQPFVQSGERISGWHLLDGM